MSLSELKEMFIEIGYYLYHRYLCIDLSQYNNFSLGAKNTLIPQIVIAFVIGAMIAAILMYLEKAHTVALVSALLRAECKDEESAKSAKELGIDMNDSLLYQLRRPSSISKLIYHRGQTVSVSASAIANMGENVNSNEAKYYSSRKELLEERKKIDFQTVPLYIPQELSYRADVRYGKKPRLFVCVISVIMMPLIGILVLRLLPTVLLFADGLITFFK